MFSEKIIENFPKKYVNGGLPNKRLQVGKKSKIC